MIRGEYHTNIGKYRVMHYGIIVKDCLKMYYDSDIDGVHITPEDLLDSTFPVLNADLGGVLGYLLSGENDIDINEYEFDMIRFKLYNAIKHDELGW